LVLGFFTSATFGDSVKKAGLDGQIIRAKQLEDIASKKHNKVLAKNP